MSQIYTITEVSNIIVRHCADLFPFTWVKGEVVNCSYASNGTLYFSLKEDNILLDCVWFESKQKETILFDVLTGEVNESPTVCVSKTMKNGDYLYVAGKIAIYKERSKYQLYVELAQYIGSGEYGLAFHDKKLALEAEGLFEVRYKQKIPINPQYIGLIASKESAALQDFLHVLLHRGTGGRIFLYNTLMQSNYAIEDICIALSELQKLNIEVIVIIRGGGAKEEIDIFNDEQIVRRIFSSHIPVVTGIGHEIDETLADLVADATGITPTFVAQMLFEERNTIAQAIHDNNEHLYSVLDTIIYHHEAKLRKIASLLYVIMEEKIASYEQSLQRSISYYIFVIVTLVERKKKLFIGTVKHYQALYGYVYSAREEKDMMYLAKNLHRNIYRTQKSSTIVYRMMKKKLENYTLFVILKAIRRQLEYIAQRMYMAIDRTMLCMINKIGKYAMTLQCLSPENIISQGYVCVENEKGERVSSALSLNRTVLFLHFKDGTLCVQAISKE